jgi:hypothetical protein
LPTQSNNSVTTPIPHRAQTAADTLDFQAAFQRRGGDQALGQQVLAEFHPAIRNLGVCHTATIEVNPRGIALDLEGEFPGGALEVHELQDRYRPEYGKVTAKIHCRLPFRACRAERVATR